eukprot:CAMPEP_0178426034 /NCGR_PEP_ID=MMETSP0689_2-20121128/29029_1 /TAXON_ID=160604 /ORGANISM="Amphidinium massartii, Strain CS-259" /LENGTH=133 /DNA_ID=CAMNT_0020047713 /DNA_START=52 /DNA_END=453 /DNA_ORIENTATION=-
MPADAAPDFEPDAADVKEQQAALVKEFDAKGAEVREYLNGMLGTQMREALQELAKTRPADPQKVLAEHFNGKKSIGEFEKATRTQEASLLKAAPRGYLQSTVGGDLVPALVSLYTQESRRPVSDLGAMLAKKG